MTYLHDAGEWDNKNVGAGEVADDGVDARGSATVDQQPDTDQCAADSAEHNLNVEDDQTRRLVEHGVGHMRRSLSDCDWFRFCVVVAVRHYRIYEYSSHLLHSTVIVVNLAPPTTHLVFLFSLKADRDKIGTNVFFM